MRLGSHINEEIKQKLRLAKLGKKHTKEHNRNISLSISGEKHWNFGKSTPEKTLKKMSSIKMGKQSSKESNQKRRLALLGEKNFMHNKHHTEETKKLMKQNHTRCWLGKHHSEKIKKEKSLFHKKLWQDINFAKKMIKAQHIQPNKPEIFLSNLLNNVLPNEYKYVGDGEFILAGKCPDFVNVNGQKKIIELFGDYWHGENFTKHSVEQEEKQRIDLFNQYGYSTLIVWERELKNINELKNKILNFNGGLL